MRKDSPPPPLPAAAPPQYTHLYQPGPTSYQAIPLVPTTRPRRSTLRRFLLAFFLAVVLGASASLCSRIMTLITQGKIFGGHRWGAPSGLKINQCVTGDAWAIASADVSRPPHWTGTPFDLSLERDSILLVGSYPKRGLAGSLEVTTSPALNGTATVSIMTVEGSRDGDVRACGITGRAGEVGVGIFTRGWRWPWNRTHLKIRLVLPETGMPVLQGLTVDLPSFDLNIGNLGSKIWFDEVSLTTTNSPVRVKSLSAVRATLRTSNGAIKAESIVSQNLKVRTSNAPISGTYNSSSSLSLETSNAPINVDVGLTSDDVKHTELYMRTSNNVLDARISLLTPNGTFQTKARTSNGRLGLAFPAFGDDAALKLTARTSNAPAQVVLNPAYEGWFEGRTSGHQSLVVERSGSGSGEEEDVREIEYEGRERDGRRAGYVYKGKEGRGRGRVEVRTSNAGIKLFL
ncbi:hypothetical protein FB45DRAFT_1030708 [Roridomyces roridus]|uniref:DUF4097 domain-containing protein n=1 Tax=Roridomyces roridus TaxID=1738132 RepID=A0AAD7BLZ6_9AGAR|nr:hypothetical protein FB45DRAFT_1030708 [Roridomyces roridus]